LAGGFNSSTEEYYGGILMEKYQSSLSRCKIPLRAEVLLRFGKQLRSAISTLHDCGFCHMDIKPANVFISVRSDGATCFLGDYGGATKVGERVREHTLSYYPTDAGDRAKQETDFLLLVVTLLELFGLIPSPPSPMSVEQIKAKVASVENDQVKTFLNELLAIA
jgi:serine/threonine protein kinase